MTCAHAHAASVPVALGWGLDDSGQLAQGIQVAFPTPTPIDQTGALASKTVVKTVSSGRHVLALTSDGKVYAWGDNSSQQLGNNSNIPSSSPVQVGAPGELASKTVIDIAVTQNTSFLLTTDFQLWGWGTGALGGVNATLTGLPIRINSGALTGKNIVKIATGTSHVLVLTSDGVVATFGTSNINGQQGTNSTASSNTPLAIVDANGVLTGKTIVDVAAGVNSSLARSSDGLLFAWGANSSGQLGVANKTQQLAPVLVGGSLVGKSVTAMAISNSVAYAIASDNTLHSWGSNGLGALGAGVSAPTLTESLVPIAAVMTPFAGLTLHSVTAGSSSAAVRTTTGEVFTWGNNTLGTLGSDFPTSRNTAAQVSFAALGSGLSAVAVNADGGNFMSAVLSDGRAVIWGHATFGRTGSGQPFLRGSPFPIPVTALPAGQRWTLLAAGQNHSVGVSTAGRVYSWGNNGSGQLGNGSPSSAPVTSPQLVLSTGGVLNSKVATAIAAGVSHNVVLTQDGLVYAWGFNSSGQLGDNSTSSRTSAVALTTTGTPLAGKTMAKIVAGNNHTLALTTDGVLVAWGSDSNGQLGDDVSSSNRTVATAVSTAGVLAGKTVVDIAAGGMSSYALTSDGLVFAWGLNGNGQLGNGGTTQSNIPVAVTTSGVMAGKTLTRIFAAENNAYAIASDGTLFGWGANSGQLANGQQSGNVTAPIVMSLPAGHTHRIPASVNGSFRHVNVVTTDGAVFSAGNGGFGALALGEASFGNQTTLTHVPGTGKENGIKVLATSSNGQGQHVVATAEYTQPELVVQHPVGTALSAGSASISFGSAAPNTNVQRTIRLTNLGEANLNSLAVSVSTPTVGSFSIIGTVPTSLSENQSVTLIVQYAASTLGSYSATLQVTSSDPTNPTFNVTLSGDVITPVSIQTPPATQTVNPGTPVTLSVVASGTPTLTYQWIKNGVPIDGAILSSLNLGAVTESAQGNYAVTVTNAAGSVTTDAVAVSVNDPVIITTPPSSQTVNPGAQVTLSVAATGTTPIAYAWRKNGQPIDGANSSTLNLGLVTKADAGDYDVIVSNVVGPVTSSTAVIEVNDPVEIIAPPASQTVNPGTLVSFSVSVSGTGPFSYVWRKNSNPINGADGSSLQLGAVAEANEGSYDVIVSNVVGVVASTVATLSVNDPVTIVTPPQSASRSPGESVTFSVVATGTGPFAYVWRRDQVPILGATADTLTLENLQPGPMAFYDVIVSNVVGPVTSDPASLTVAGAVPVILTPPQSALVKQGDPVTLQVAAIGLPPLRYQWKFNGKNLRGATAATLSLPAATLKQAGEYQVVVTSQQSVTSDSVTVGVIAFQGGPRSLAAGGKTQATVVTAGGTMGFEWRKDNQPLPADSRITGGDTPTLSIRALDPGTDMDPGIHSGAYTCRVTLAGLPMIETEALQLKVFDSQPRLMTPITLPPAAIGLDYTTFIPVDTNPQRAPQRFTASGLPPGLKLNAVTGEIFGRPLASKVGGYNIKISASNSLNKVSTEATLNVRALPPAAMGSFAAVIAPEADVNGQLGGQLDFKILPSGAISGSARLGAQRLAFKGLLNASLTSEVTEATLTIPRKGRAGLLLTFTIDENATPDPLVGEIEDPEAVGPGIAQIAGWRDPWTKEVKANAFVGAHNLALLPPVAERENLLLPQGIGFGTFNVGSNGKLRVTGKLADGQGFAVPAFVGAGGQIAVFQALYRGRVRGSVCGRCVIASGAPLTSPAGNSLSGDLVWNRPADLSGKSRLYPAGFSLLTLTLEGGGYLPPVAEGLLLGLTPPNDLAVLAFEAALPADLPTRPDISARLLPRGRVQLPLTNPTGTTLRTVPKTGALSGGFTVLDGGVRRAVKFQGQVVPLATGSIGVGFFLLPQLGVPSPLIRSGTVTLGPP